MKETVSMQKKKKVIPFQILSPKNEAQVFLRKWLTVKSWSLSSQKSSFINVYRSLSTHLKINQKMIFHAKFFSEN